MCTCMCEGSHCRRSRGIEHHRRRCISSFLVSECRFHVGIPVVSANAGTTRGQRGGWTVAHLDQNWEPYTVIPSSTSIYEQTPVYYTSDLGVYILNHLKAISPLTHVDDLAITGWELHCYVQLIGCLHEQVPLYLCKLPWVKIWSGKLTTWFVYPYCNHSKRVIHVVC